METLIGEYESNEAAIKKANDAALTKASIALVAGAVAYASGGTLAPAAYLAWLAVNDKFSAGTVDSQKFIDAMGTILSLMDSALSDVNIAYSRPYGMPGNIVLQEIDLAGKETGGTITVDVRGYINDYNDYMSAGAAHLPGETKESLYAKVQQNAGQVDSHSFAIIDSYRHYSLKPSTKSYTWITWGLPSDYECDGPCVDMFRSPHEALTAHREKCGPETTKNVETEAWEQMQRINIIPSGYDVGDPIAGSLVAHKAMVSEILKTRTVAAGCGRFYYNCPSVPDTEHQVLTCAKDYVYKDADGNKKKKTCGDSFRICMGHTKDHHVSWPGSSRHSTNKLEYGNETPPLTMPSPPSYHVCGVHEDWQSGDHSLQASCSETDSHGQSCTVTNFYACQSHTHEYPALISGACGHSYTSSSSYSHRSETCPTNSNGDSCTAGSYYACQSHTHAYPAATVVCGRAACTETVSSTEEHRETCTSGHPYWTCKPSHVHLHKTRTCRRSGCGQSWVLCTSQKPTCRVNSAWKCRAQ